MSNIILFNDKKECCGCGACMNVCPKSAITMQEDEFGFVYPIIDNDTCIECGACKKVCGYQSIPEKHQVKSVYAAANRNDNSLKKSASGGVFAVLAEHVIDNGGVVYGSSMETVDGKLTPMHIRIDKKSDIIKLQGSKYVQSDIGFSYKAVRKDLLDGIMVLFSGTPCQIAGLRQFLQKDYDNLLLAEIICHGVPSKQLFQDFIENYGNKLGGKIQEFYFRDKSKDQGMITRACYVVRNRKTEKVKHGQLLSYMSFFLKSYTYRINCYSCPFATPERAADLTLGDFWGFHEEYPSYHEELSNGKGISCLLVNTEKGSQVIDKCSSNFSLMYSDFEKVLRHNDQLHSPSKYSSKREEILDIYKANGYTAVEDYFHKNYKKDILKYSLSSAMPKGLKRSIKKLVGLLGGRK